MCYQFSPRSFLIALTSLFLVGTLATGGTYIWLTAATNQDNPPVHAVVTGGTNPELAAALAEPRFADSMKAKTMVMAPGSTVDKDPLITNTSTAELSEWAGMKVTFTKGDGETELKPYEMELLNRVIAYTVNPGWVRKNTSAQPRSTEIFYYDKILAQGASTASVFDKVSIRESAVNADLEVIKDKWNGFQLVIRGAVVQSDLAEALDDTVRKELDALLYRR